MAEFGESQPCQVKSYLPRPPFWEFRQKKWKNRWPWLDVSRHNPNGCQWRPISGKESVFKSILQCICNIKLGFSYPSVKLRGWVARSFCIQFENSYMLTLESQFIPVSGWDDRVQPSPILPNTSPPPCTHARAACLSTQTPIQPHPTGT